MNLLLILFFSLDLRQGFRIVLISEEGDYGDVLKSPVNTRLSLCHKSLICGC
ncbi:hypothetical protein VCHA47P369_70022 [Vibrio chagasii]|nr:hypothetical protein VCHA51O448_200023 [Vibrio chagasii]CAH7167346.1 hypothetical protein VCHA48P435_30030 [Vibrio chagasii]CAH7320327.1 hypothetical protein VCHA47P369_70022 [Vibrio chagasii]